MEIFTFKSGLQRSRGRTAMTRCRCFGANVLPVTLLIIVAASCTRQEPDARRFLLIGVDGAEWSVIEELWEEGELPNLRRLSEAGARAALATDYGLSPVIWNTVATGMSRERHGITGFVVPTPDGDRPVASTMRKVPAIWDMISTTGRKVAVLGWWASWPAQPVNGVLVTDRLLHAERDRVWPPEDSEWLTRGMEEALRGPRLFPDYSDERNLLRHDEVIAFLGSDLVRREFDLVMLYLRAPDVVSHHKWKYFRPDDPAYETVDPVLIERYSDHVPGAYRAVDAAIGRLIAAAPGDPNVFVLSDHGFEAQSDRLRIRSDLDPLLEHLGLLVRDERGGIDHTATKLYTYATERFERNKRLRFPTAGREPHGRVTAAQRQQVAQQLTDALNSVRYQSSGVPVFAVRQPSGSEKSEGADLVVDVLPEGVDTTILVEGQPMQGVVQRIHQITGGHAPDKKGIFIAAGPDIDPAARIDGISVFDVTPTLLYGLGLPVAEDFDGRAWTDLYSSEFRKRYPLRKITTWGTRRSKDALATEADEQIIDDLRALGYLN